MLLDACHLKTNNKAKDTGKIVDSDTQVNKSELFFEYNIVGYDFFLLDSQSVPEHDHEVKRFR